MYPQPSALKTKCLSVSSPFGPHLRSKNEILAGFTTLSAPRSAQAQRGKAGNEFDYYSDATFTHRVGVLIVCSNGQTFRSGVVTDFVRVQPSGC
jgi:hypothetical protein